VRLVRAVPKSATVGVLATLSMDAFFVAAARLGGERFTSDKVGLELVGRWAAGLARGQYLHEDIAQEPALRGEAALGLAVHYLTGVALTRVYYALLRRGGLEPGVLSASVYGAVTALLPTMVMYPSWGLGLFALRSDDPSRLLRIMLLGHTTFGAAIGLWTGLLSPHDSRPHDRREQELAGTSTS
jgi:hypothetical protein